METNISVMIPQTDVVTLDDTSDDKINKNDFKKKINRVKLCIVRTASWTESEQSFHTDRVFQLKTLSAAFHSTKCLIKKINTVKVLKAQQKRCLGEV